jgi:hypothetical protein
VILGQLEAQASCLTWASGVGVAGVLERIANGLDASTPTEADLAADLRRRAGLRRDR